jgi:membrane associated rhomboid family serine protease
MHQASVGFHCPECLQQGRQRVLTARTLPGGGQAVVTMALIAVNVAVFVVDAASGSALSGGGNIDGLTLDGGLVACLPEEACAAGYDAGDGVIGVDAGQWYRIVTSGFLHDGLIHIGFNMLILWLLGQQLEPALGRLRFALVYFVGLLAGSFGVMLLSPNEFTVGASGAVFGLFGAAVVLQRSRGINPFETGLGGLIVINLLITFTLPGISIGGHVGGLIGGAVAGALLVELPRRLPGPPPGGVGAAGVSTVVPAAATAAFGVALFVGSVWAASEWMSGGVL